MRFVSYLRVSTDRQGKSGLGIEGQREAVASYLGAGDRVLIGEHVETESGRNNARPALAKALAQCRLTGATLIVAKIDRLSRDTRFLLSVIDGCGAGGVTFCDLPNIPDGAVGKFMLTQMASVAELEAGLISQRTKAALGAAKARGVKLGGWRGGPVVDHALGIEAVKARADRFAAAVGPMAREMREGGASLGAIAAALAGQGIKTPRGGAWTATAVKNLLARDSLDRNRWLMVR